MKFKKGDKIRTDDGQVGEILFIDNDGVEAQVALERISVRLGTDTLQLFEATDTEVAGSHTAGIQRPTGKQKRVRRASK